MARPFIKIYSLASLILSSCVNLAQILEYLKREDVKTRLRGVRMKRFLILGAILGSLGLAGCGDNGSGDGGGGGVAVVPGSEYANTPQPCNTNNTNQAHPYGHYQGSNPYAYGYGGYNGYGYGQGQNCQYNSYYSNWNPNQIAWNYGAWYWPVQYQATGANCGCPTGYYPVQGPTYGTACAPVQYFSNQVVYANIGFSAGFQYWNQPQNGGFLNTPNLHYQGPATAGACTSSTAQGCDVRQNTCPSGSRCQAVGGGSTIGLCVR